MNRETGIQNKECQVAVGVRQRFLTFALRTKFLFFTFIFSQKPNVVLAQSIAFDYHLLTNTLSICWTSHPTTVAT